MKKEGNKKISTPRQKVIHNPIPTSLFLSRPYPFYVGIVYIGALLLESVVWCTGLVRCPEFGGCPLLESRKCIASTGIAVGTSTVVRYTVDVRYWECPLSEVPLYIPPSLP